MTNIVSLKGGPIQGELNAALIETLERHLEQAKAGMIVGCAYVTELSNGTFITGWDRGPNSYCILAGAQVLAHRLLSDDA